MPQVKITKSVFDELAYDTKDLLLNTNNMSSSAAELIELATPTVMVVFASSDLNAATYHLAKGVATNAVATVLVQESASELFIEKVREKLTPNNSNLTQHTGFQKVLSTIERLKLRTIVGNNIMPRSNSPTLVCDVTHDHLGSKGAPGIATFHVFRTAKEAIALVGKESLTFANASIWNDNFSCSYELVAALSCRNFYLNCNNVPMNSIKEQCGQSFALINGNFHYESLQQEKTTKMVVFPIGTIFAN